MPHVMSSSHDDAVGLLTQLHGKVLRRGSQQLGRHFEGLAQMSRELRRRGGSNRVAKQLCQLDTVCGWVRHVTSIRCEQMLMELEQSLSALLTVSPLVSELSSPSVAQPFGFDTSFVSSRPDGRGHGAREVERGVEQASGRDVDERASIPSPSEQGCF